jgi:transglutaminase-like putative cysteine protease
LPARFIIGFPLPPDKSSGSILGYHCWAEFYLEDRGWVPVDISEAIKHPDKHEYFYGTLDEHRVEFTMGRDIQLAPTPAPEPRNFFIYPVAMIDGKTKENVDWTVAFKDVEGERSLPADRIN